jgi:hypothetical protein
LALRASGRFAGGLHGRQEQRNEHTNDCDHDEQFDEREGGSRIAAAARWRHTDPLCSRKLWIFKRCSLATCQWRATRRSVTIRRGELMRSYREGFAADKHG